MNIFAVAIAFSLLTSACTKNEPMSATDLTQSRRVEAVDSNTKTYLALGDSYTIGESVKQAESFPFQLQKLLQDKWLHVAQPRIIAKTGWTTNELQEAIKLANVREKFDIVTLLIGVNNQYRGYPTDTYRKEFSALLQTAIAFANGDKKKVFVISIPDWGVTPFGLSSGKSVKSISAEIDNFNSINKEITLNAGISYTDITPHSRTAAIDHTLIAPDGLHPGEKMYAYWVNELYPKILAEF